MHEEDTASLDAECPELLGHLGFAQLFAVVFGRVRGSLGVSRRHGESLAHRVSRRAVAVAVDRPDDLDHGRIFA
jgi:hypothetical protein